MYDIFPTGIHWVRLTHNNSIQKYVVIKSELHDMYPPLAHTTYHLENEISEQFEKRGEALSYLKDYPLKDGSIVLHKDYEDREELYYIVQKDFDLFQKYLKECRHEEKDKDQIKAEILAQFGTSIKGWEDK